MSKPQQGGQVVAAFPMSLYAFDPDRKLFTAISSSNRQEFLFGKAASLEASHANAAKIKPSGQRWDPGTLQELQHAHTLQRELI